MFASADQTLMRFTLSQDLQIQEKADKTLVTACDEKIDSVLTQIATESGLNVVSEEGEKSIEIVESGNYITIDPIDGTLAYLEHLKAALATGEISNFLKIDLGKEWDFCLLVGIVEDAQPKYGGVLNYVTKEIILIDSSDHNSLVREGKQRIFEGKNVAFVDQRKGDEIESEIISQIETNVYPLASYGLRVVYTFLNNFESAIAYHSVQQTGLWDILPGAAVAKAMGQKIYTNMGNELSLNEYIALPGKGALAIKGDKFKFALEKILSKK
jgi:fructose-1,6-bisphosphatase/inositol monophosphatase family enzyme